MWPKGIVFSHSGVGERERERELPSFASEWYVNLRGSAHLSPSYRDV